MKSVPDLGQDDGIRLTNRAMDVRSACILYLAAQLKHDKTWLGTIGRILLADWLTGAIGKVIKTLFAGDDMITDAATCLAKSVNDYRQAIDGTNLVIGLEILKIVKGTILNLASLG